MPRGDERGRPRPWCGRAIRALAGGLALAWVSAAQAGGTIYAFVDARGVTHFTNSPNDPRYAPMRPVEPGRFRRPPPGWRYDGLILLAARQHGLPPALVKAVIAAESRFDAEAVSHKGAVGLMQLMPETARSLGVQDPRRPEENVAGGVRYLRGLVDRYGDLARALAAYNAGPKAVDRYGGIPPYKETRDYVRRVLAYYRDYDAGVGR